MPLLDKIAGNRPLVVALLVLCPLLTAVSLWAGWTLYQQDRFVAINEKTPFLRFDRRTAQTCWSGAPDLPETLASNDPVKRLFEAKPGGSFDYGRPPSDLNNPYRVPFCKDLK